MFCPECGFDNTENSKFCQKCGAKLVMPTPEPVTETVTPEAPKAEPIPEETIVPEAPYVPPTPNPLSNNPQCGPELSQNSVIDIVRNAAKSVPFLIAISAATMAFLMTLFSSFKTIGNFGKLVQFWGGDSSFTAVLYFIAILVLIPTFLMCLAYWLIFASGFNKRPPMSTAGLTIIKVFMIISIVLISICFAIFLISMLATIASIANYPYSSDETAVMVVTTVVGVAVFAFAILYYAKIVSTINSAKYTINTGIPNCKVSIYVAVINIIGIVINVISLIFSLITIGAINSMASYYDYYEIGMQQVMAMFTQDTSMIVANVLNIASSLCFTIVLLNYRSKMKNAMYANHLYI